MTRGPTLCTFALIGGSLLLASCAGLTSHGPAPRQGVQPADHARAVQRVRRLARALLIANAVRCPGRHWDYGFTAQAEPRPEPAPKPGGPAHAGAAKADEARAGEPEGYLVARIDPAGPADGAGVRPGDRLIAVNGAPWTDPQFAASFAGTDGAAPDRQRLRLQFVRGNEPFAVVLTGEPICAIPAVFVVRRQVNAVANPTGFAIYSGLERAMNEDAQLSAVIAHEMAHVMLGHQSGAMPPGPERWRRRQADEQAADALSVRLLRSAGIDPEAAVRAIGTLGRYRGPISRLLGIDGPYLPTARRQQFLRDQIDLARAEAMPSEGL